MITTLKTCLRISGRYAVPEIVAHDSSCSGAFQCAVPRRCTRPGILRRVRSQSCLHGVVLYVCRDAFQLVIVPYPVVVGLPLPKRLSRSGEDLIGLSCRPAFQPLEHATSGLLRAKQNMNVIAHDHVSGQFVESHGEAPPERLYDQAGHLRTAQKHRPPSGGVQVAVHPYEGFPGRRLVRRRI
jgi:hypothetical protein